MLEGLKEDFAEMSLEKNAPYTTHSPKYKEKFDQWEQFIKSQHISLEILTNLCTIGNFAISTILKFADDEYPGSEVLIAQFNTLIFDTPFLKHVCEP